MIDRPDDADPSLSSRGDRPTEAPTDPPPDPRRRGSLGQFRDRLFGLAPPRGPADRPLGLLSPEQARLATAGLELGGGILVFAAIGYGMDRLFGTAPVFVVALALLGLIGGLYRLIKAVQPPAK